MSAVTDPTCKAWLDLVALVLILGGTAVITLGGAPVVIRNLVTFGKQKTVFGDQKTAFGLTSDPEAAVRRYRVWAVPGFVAITLGALLQALEPISVLFPHAQLLAVCKCG